eukprot:UN02039
MNFERMSVDSTILSNTYLSTKDGVLKDFYAVPFRLEFTLFFGACLCFDSVLFIITLPLTLFVHLIRFRFKEFTFDSIRFVAYCVVVSCLDEWLNFGKYYHIIRVQSMFSLF